MVNMWKYRGGEREEHYVGRRAIEMEVQGRRKRGALCRKEGDRNGSTAKQNVTLHEFPKDRA